ncbi:MAG: cell division protein ZapE [Sphingomonadaceae bacterium]
MSVADRYRALIASGELRADSIQAETAARLNRLQAELEAVPPRGSILWRLGKAKPPPPPRGVYLWGGVGRGKSMLMDLFFERLKINRKRRVHFHEFMIEVHDRLRLERMNERGDPIPPVVAALADQARCLAFDEMVVNNSADAMILSRLFTGLLDAGVTVVATSNRPPADLYKDGLNREHFLPFIATIAQRLDVIALNGPTDYRMARMAGAATWHVPNGADATAAVREVFFRLTDFPPEDAVNVPTAEIELGGGRLLHVPKSLKGVAVFSFKRLCGEPRGAADYLAIARRYHSVVIVGIPRLGPENRNEAARFVTLIDALYEHHVKLIATSDADPAQLYEDGDGKFEFERTVSRLVEMQAADYLAEGHGPR